MSEKKTEDLLTLAKAQYKRCVDAESVNRDDQLADLKFYAASPDNQWQWDEQALKARKDRPCLTINKLPQHVRQVTNEVRQNRPQIKVVPVDDKADTDTATMLNGIIRHIQYSSDADVAYDTAAETQVTIGVGYLRVLTDYIGDDSFDQDIRIKRVRNPFTVHMDPDAQEPDGSDAQFVFIDEMIEEDEYKRQYPDADPVDWDAQNLDPNWYDDKKVRIAEWWRVETRPKVLNLMPDGSSALADQADPGALKTRKVEARVVMFRKLCGHTVLEEREWAGKYIPVARAIGNEFDIEGKLYITGLVRNAKDAARMYNYWASQEVEMLALAPKAPFIGYAGQFEGYERKWQTANVANYPYLEVNPVVDQATQQVLPLPQRAMPPMPSSGILQAKAGASDDIKATTGQYDASLGQKSNETSGKAIMARQREGDTGTFHYVDNLSRAIRHVGRIIVDLIPKIYDTKRVARILGEDDSVDMAVIDPNLPQAKVEQRDGSGKLQKLYNPSIGRYDVAVIVGPSFTTKRQEAAQSMAEMTQANPQLWTVIGDLLVRAQDWPGADEMAKRLKAMLPPEIAELEREDNPMPPEARAALQQAMEQMEQMQAALQQLQGELAEAQDKNAIEMYKAETDRMQALAPAIPPEAVQMIVSQTVQELLSQPQPDAFTQPMGEPG